MVTDKRPVIKGVGDLRVFQSTEVEQNAKGEVTRGDTIHEWYHFTADDEAYVGASYKTWDDITLEECAAALERIPDDSLYPELPADPPITIAPESLDEGAAFIKRVGFARYHPLSEGGILAGYEGKDELLAEVLRMEMLSKRPHPYIVQYLGCRVRRGRITGIVLESLRWTLGKFARDAPDKFAELDKAAFLAGVESAVKFLHSLGLAHNDISPNNIMVRQAGNCSFSPVLIDFGSCGMIGTQLLSAGTPGFMEEDDPEECVSLKRHDEFSLNRVHEWWDRVLEPKD
jgi:hypothetical protein